MLLLCCLTYAYIFKFLCHICEDGPFRRGTVAGGIGWQQEELEKGWMEVVRIRASAVK